MSIYSSIKSWIRHWLDPHWHCSAFIALLKKIVSWILGKKSLPVWWKKKFPPPAWWKKNSLPLPDEKKNSLPLSGGKKNSLPSGKNHSPPIDINWYVPNVRSANRDRAQKQHWSTVERYCIFVLCWVIYHWANPSVPLMFRKTIIWSLKINTNVPAVSFMGRKCIILSV